MVLYYRRNGKWEREGQCFLNVRLHYCIRDARVKHRHEVLWTLYPHRLHICSLHNVMIWKVVQLYDSCLDWLSTLTHVTGKSMEKIFQNRISPKNITCKSDESYIYFSTYTLFLNLVCPDRYKGAQWWTTSAREVTSRSTATVGHTKIMSSVFFLGLYWKC